MQEPAPRSVGRRLARQVGCGGLARCAGHGRPETLLGRGATVVLDLTEVLSTLAVGPALLPLLVEAARPRVQRRQIELVEAAVAA